MPKLNPTYECSGSEKLGRLQEAMHALDLSLGRDDFPVKARFETRVGSERVLIEPLEDIERVYVEGKTRIYCYDVKTSQFSLQSGDTHYALNLIPTNSH